MLSSECSSRGKTCICSVCGVSSHIHGQCCAGQQVKALVCCLLTCMPVLLLLSDCALSLVHLLMLHVMFQWFTPATYRERRVLSSTQCVPEKPAQLPELLPCNSSPDTAHERRFSKAKQQQAEVCETSSSGHYEGRHQQAHDDEAELHAEATFSQTDERAQSAATAAACCLRCGLSQSQRASDCRFHPALLTDPGPFLYSPEWHACRAAKHDCTYPGCYVRQGHYFPGRAVQGVISATAIAKCPELSTVQFDLQPQPRTRLPLPRCKAYS